MIVENVQTFLYRALFYLLEAPLGPSQKQKRYLNAIRFSVPFLGSGPVRHFAGEHLQHKDVVELIKNKLGLSSSTTTKAGKSNTTITKFFQEVTPPTNKNVGNHEDAQRLAFLETLKPVQLDLFKTLLESGGLQRA